MPIYHLITHQCDLDAPLKVTPLKHTLIMGDDQGDRFEITVTQNGKAASLSGGSVLAYFMRAADGNTVIINGSVSGNVVAVTIPKACYVVPGRFTLTVKVTVGNVRNTVYVCDGAVLRSSTDSIVDPSHTVPDLSELLAMISKIEQSTDAANAATNSANNAAASANTAANQANAARDAANTATSAAKAATESANTATSQANAARDAANAAKQAADTATANANAATSRANEATSQANTARDAANAAADRVDASIASSAEATDAAWTAARNANESASAADDAADSANTAANRLSEVELIVDKLPASADPTGSVTQTDTKTTFELGIPTSNLAYSTFEVTDDMQLLMHSPDGFSDITFALNDGNLEVHV